MPATSGCAVSCIFLFISSLLHQNARGAIWQRVRWTIPVLVEPARLYLSLIFWKAEMKATLKSQFAPENACLVMQGETSTKPVIVLLGSKWYFSEGLNDLQIFAGV